MEDTGARGTRGKKRRGWRWEARGWHSAVSSVCAYMPSCVIDSPRSPAASVPTYLMPRDIVTSIPSYARYTRRRRARVLSSPLLSFLLFSSVFCSFLLFPLTSYPFSPVAIVLREFRLHLNIWF